MSNVLLRPTEGWTGRGVRGEGTTRGRVERTFSEQENSLDPEVQDRLIPRLSSSNEQPASLPFMRAQGHRRPDIQSN